MPSSQADIELYAARIRLHFSPELRDTTSEPALGIARIVGVRAKDLRPEARLAEIFHWFHREEPFPASLDQVEWVMALEEELGIDMPDDLAAKPELTTFYDLVLHRARKRAA